MFQILLEFLGFSVGPKQFDKEEELALFVQLLMPISTVAMFATVLIVQQSWVGELDRPGWVNAATGIAVLGWMVGAALVLIGFAGARWILPIASASGLLAQWGDTLGGEVGFDLGFYRVQGYAIAIHFVLSVLLALWPTGDAATPSDAIRA